MYTNGTSIFLPSFCDLVYSKPGRTVWAAFHVFGQVLLSFSSHTLLLMCVGQACLSAQPVLGVIGQLASTHY